MFGKKKDSDDMSKNDSTGRDAPADLPAPRTYTPRAEPLSGAGRAPLADELARGVKFLQDQAEIISGRDTPTSLPVPMPEGPTPAQASAMVDFCHALLNLNEFVFVD